MALSKHKKHLLNLYITSLLGFVAGIVIILAGVFVSLQLQDEIIKLGRDLGVLK